MSENYLKILLQLVKGWGQLVSDGFFQGNGLEAYRVGNVKFSDAMF